MKRYTFYATDLGGTLPGEGSMIEEPNGHYCGYSEVAELVSMALASLESDHVKKNTHRMGVLGSVDVESAILILKGMISPPVKTTI